VRENENTRKTAGERPGERREGVGGWGGGHREGGGGR